MPGPEVQLQGVGGASCFYKSTEGRPLGFRFPCSGGPVLALAKVAKRNHPPGARARCAVEDGSLLMRTDRWAVVGVPLSC